jgi:hypothetical protein
MMNDLLQSLYALFTRRNTSWAFGCYLLAVGIQAQASGSNGLIFPTGDVFPLTCSERSLTDDPEYLRVAQAAPESQPAKSWQGARPPTDKFDWLQTTPGEWLKGSLKVLFGAAASYNIIATQVTTWDVSGGPGYRATLYVNVQPGNSQKVSTPALLIGTSYSKTLTKTVDFNGSYNFSVVNEQSGIYTHHAIGTFEVGFTEVIDLNISFV